MGAVGNDCVRKCGGNTHLPDVVVILRDLQLQLAAHFVALQKARDFKLLLLFLRGVVVELCKCRREATDDGGYDAQAEERGDDGEPLLALCVREHVGAHDG